MDDRERVAFFRQYYTDLAKMALGRGFGFLLENTITWKASLHRAVNTLGLTREKWEELMASSNNLMADVCQRMESEFPNQDIAIGGVIGAREGGYDTESPLSVEESEDYHAPAIQLFSRDKRV